MAAALVLALAALSLVAPSAPGYDPWAWLLWGREVAHLELDTVDGPAFKPLPVAVAVVLDAFGGAAPELWLVVARAGALAAIALAARLAWRLTAPATRPSKTHSRVHATGNCVFDGPGVGWRGRRWVAAVVAGGGVALCQGWWWHAAVGNAEGLFLALALAGATLAADRRHGGALAFGMLAALLRPEAWPFLALYGLWLWRREPRLRAALVAGAVAVPALWVLPELWGSGDPARSSERARIPNPGQPATADVPSLASLGEALAIPLAVVLPLAVLGARQRGPVRWVAGAAAAWLLLVALMAERGYSGEPRYALPGAALLAVAAGVGAVTLGRRWRVAAAVVAVPLVAIRLDGLAKELGRAHDDARLWGSLPAALEAAGGREAALACGRPATGRFRGTGVAYALEVPKRVVDAEGDARGAGLVLRSRLRPGHGLQPPAPPGSRVLARSARWELRCGR